MKKPFQGIECRDPDAFFGPEWSLEKAIYLAAVHRDSPYRLMVGQGYRCCEYKKRINIFSFGKAKLTLPFTVIAPPASIDRVGYFGDLTALINDYSKRKGLFLILNERHAQPVDAACAHTLSSAIFLHRFSNIEEYKADLRSSYRRRITLAEKKGASLQWKKIPSESFDPTLYDLYLQVLRHSDFPLETLGIEFFRSCPGEIYVLLDGTQPMAFLMMTQTEEQTNFIFGGMNYCFRDKYDLYYNMMIKVLDVGFANQSERIDFGQTAENTKCRLGCVLEPRYLIFFSGNPVLNFLAKKMIGWIEYRPERESYHVFK